VTVRNALDAAVCEMQRTAAHTDRMTPCRPASNCWPEDEFPNRTKPILFHPLAKNPLSAIFFFLTLILLFSFSKCTPSLRWSVYTMQLDHHALVALLHSAHEGACSLHLSVLAATTQHNTILALLPNGTTTS
jgi:hypothetical protein